MSKFFSKVSDSFLIEISHQNRWKVKGYNKQKKKINKFYFNNLNGT